MGAAAALDARRARRRADPVQPFGLQHHDRQGRRAQIALRLARRAAAAPPMSFPPPGRGESTTDLAWDGQGSIYELGELLAETEPVRLGAGACGRRHRRRSGCGSSGCGCGTFNDNAARAPAIPRRRFRTHRASSTSRTSPTSASSGSCAASPTCRTGRSSSIRIATRRSTSRCQGLAKRFQATTRQASRHRRLGRARFDPCPDRRRQGLRLCSACRARRSSASPCRASPPARRPRPMPGR